MGDNFPIAVETERQLRQIVGAGGALYNAGDASLQGSTVSGNSAVDGGGLFNAATGTLSVQESSVIDNFALLGGDHYDAGDVFVGGSIIGVRYDV